MTKINIKITVKETLFFSLLLMATLAMSIPALADCHGDPENYLTSIVTYYQDDLIYNPDLTDSRCTRVVNSVGRVVCRVRLRGTVYSPRNATSTTKFPALVVNHGSEETFEAFNKFCQIANYFVPKGYIVFVPFRRGHGDNDGPQDKSNGIYIETLLDDLESPNPTYNHPTFCTTRGCYKAEILEQQAEFEIPKALAYLKNRPDIKREADGEYPIAIMGNSYGGAVTALSNKDLLGQKAAVVFSPGAQNWAVAVCAPDDPTCGSPLQRSLLSAAKNARKPAFYLQAKWDYDTRPTIDMAYAHAYGSSDPTHGNRFMASIFPYPNPCPGRPCTDDDYQSVHAGFFGEPNRWGTEVLEFIRQYGVK